MSEALALQLEDLDLSDTELEDVLDYTITSVIAIAVFADFSLPKFVAQTGAEPPRGFPAATLRVPGRGVFSVFPSGKIVSTGLRSETEARQAMADLARETGHQLAETPIIVSLTVEADLRRAVNLQALAAHVGRSVHMGRPLRFALQDPCVTVYVDGNGQLRLYDVREAGHIRETLDRVRDLLLVFATSDCEE